MSAETHGIPVVILAGGLGTRLRASLPGLPKAMAPIGSHPFIEVQLRLLREQGWKDLLLCVGHQHEKIQEYLGDGERWGVKIRYAIERTRLLGTGGAVKKALELLDRRALVLNGDTYFPIDYGDLVTHHLLEHDKSSAIGTLALTRPRDLVSFGAVMLDDTDRFVSNFSEMSAGSAAGEGMHWASAGAYLFEPEITSFIPEGETISLEREVIPGVLDAGKKLAAFRSDSPVYDIGTPRSWRAFIDYYLEQNHAS